MKKLYSAIIIIFTCCTSLSSTDFYKVYYPDKFGDKTDIELFNEYMRVVNQKLKAKKDT